MSKVSEPPAADGAGDATYLEKTLRHTPTDLLLDDSVSADLIRAVWRRSIRLAVGIFLLFLVIWVFTGGLGFGGSSRSSRADDNDGLLIVGLVGGIIAFVVSWITFLNSEKQEPISEWSTLLAGRAAAADSVYSHIAGRLRERRLPIQNYFEKRTRSAYSVTGNRLVLVDGYHYVYVSVFSYGTSLYLGWSMWRVRSGSVLLQHTTGRSGGGRDDPIHRILNLERLKAMREAVHAVCREALHTAVSNVTVPTAYGFPNGMPPIEGLPYGGAPQPGAQRPPTQP